MKPTLLVLAAGIGSRYGGLKQIDSVGPGGEAVLDYSVYDALRAGFGNLVFVIRRDIETAFKQMVGVKYETRTRVAYAFQELDRIPTGYAVPEGRGKPWGTAHAAWMAAEHIQEPFAVINADDFYGAEAFQLMCAHLGKQRHSSTEYAMVGFTLRDTLSDHGHVARGLCECDSQGNLIRIVERTKIVKHGNGAIFEDEEGRGHSLSGDEVVSMNFWGLTPSVFNHLEEQFRGFLRDHIDNPTAEFYLPTVVDQLISRGVARVKVLPSSSAWYGMTYREDKPHLIRGIEELVRQGAYPEKLWG